MAEIYSQSSRDGERYTLPSSNRIMLFGIDLKRVLLISGVIFDNEAIRRADIDVEL